MKTKTEIGELSKVANQKSNATLLELLAEGKKNPRNMARITELQKGLLMYQQTAIALKWVLEKSEPNENIQYWFAP